MILRRVARPLLAAMFISGGINALRQAEGHAEAAKPLLDKTVGKQPESLPDQVPTDPVTLVRIDAAVKLVGGSLLAIGKLPRLSSLMLLGSLVPTTLAAHSFWEEKDSGRRQEQQIQFTKNLGLAGGLLLAAADTEGKPSVGWRARHAVRDASKQVQDTAESVQRTAGKTAGKASKKVGKAGKQAGALTGKAGKVTGKASKSVESVLSR
ncbi:putative membrane protein YphA (DoxX/SURF4 family) [Prauserella muralis]|nr:DoxX family protein [Prauserella muralis]TWE14060.1 putative membrane protein YphA (DoxX/SURF4 family) [Prauserella muralis]